MTFMTFFGHMKRFEMMQLVKGIAQVGELQHMTKVHYSMRNIKKVMLILRYMDETLFEREYERISHLIRISIQIYLVNALIYFLNLVFRCFIFGDIDMTSPLKSISRFWISQITLTKYISERGCFAFLIFFELIW